MTTTYIPTSQIATNPSEILWLEKKDTQVGKTTIEDIKDALAEYSKNFNAGNVSKAEILTLHRAFPDSPTYQQAAVRIQKMDMVDPLVIGGPASVEMIDREGHLITTGALNKAFQKFMDNQRTRNVMVLHSDVQVGWALPAYISKGGQIFKSGVGENGLFFICELRDDTAIAKKVADQINQGTLKSYSIAGSATKVQNMKKGETPYMQVDEMELAEVTICEKGVNQGANFELLKAELPQTGKIDKDQCGYRDATAPEMKMGINCGHCKYFNAETRTCDVVVGDIMPGDYCRLFAPTEKEDKPQAIVHRKIVIMHKDNNGNIDFQKSFMNWLEKEKKDEDPLKSGKSFATLNNYAGREAEHHRLLQEYGFPSEVPLDSMRYVPVVETETDDDGKPINIIPPWVVNEAGQDLGDKLDEDAPSFKKSMDILDEILQKARIRTGTPEAKRRFAEGVPSKHRMGREGIQERTPTEASRDAVVIGDPTQIPQKPNVEKGGLLAAAGRAAAPAIGEAAGEKIADKIRGRKPLDKANGDPEQPPKATPTPTQTVYGAPQSGEGQWSPSQPQPGPGLWSSLGRQFGQGSEAGAGAVSRGAGAVAGGVGELGRQAGQAAGAGGRAAAAGGRQVVERGAGALGAGAKRMGDLFGAGQKRLGEAGQAVKRGAIRADLAAGEAGRRVRAGAQEVGRRAVEGGRRVGTAGQEAGQRVVAGGREVGRRVGVDARAAGRGAKAGAEAAGRRAAIEGRRAGRGAQAAGRRARAGVEEAGAQMRDVRAGWKDIPGRNPAGSDRAAYRLGVLGRRGREGAKEFGGGLREGFGSYDRNTRTFDRERSGGGTGKRRDQEGRFAPKRSGARRIGQLFGATGRASGEAIGEGTRFAAQETGRFGRGVTRGARPGKAGEQARDVERYGPSAARDEQGNIVGAQPTRRSASEKFGQWLGERGRERTADVLRESGRGARGVGTGLRGKGKGQEEYLDAEGRVKAPKSLTEALGRRVGEATRGTGRETGRGAIGFGRGVAPGNWGERLRADAAGQASDEATIMGRLGRRAGTVTRGTGRQGGNVATQAGRDIPRFGSKDREKARMMNNEGVGKGVEFNPQAHRNTSLREQHQLATGLVQRINEGRDLSPKEWMQAIHHMSKTNDGQRTASFKDIDIRHADWTKPISFEDMKGHIDRMNVDHGSHGSAGKRSLDALLNKIGNVHSGDDSNGLRLKPQDFEDRGERADENWDDNEGGDGDDRQQDDRQQDDRRQEQEERQRLYYSIDKEFPIMNSYQSPVTDTFKRAFNISTGKRG